ncbi:MAG: hypothetical protein AB1679_12885 [Actinomycetota bacterium]|jgi:DNA gyrase/topoisomerase IV subunit B
MANRKRLRKEEREVVDTAVNGAFEAALPAMRQIEDIIKEQLILNVPAELAEHATREFLNRLGQELWMEGKLAQLLAGPES